MFEGKKVFFVLPHEIVREHIIQILSDNEYEVYTLTDQNKLDAIVNKFPDSIIYVNIDGTLTENEWKAYLKTLITAHPGLQVGVLSSRVSDMALVNSYIMDVGITCGMILLRQGVKESSDNMLKVLEVNEARGRRKYLRYPCGYNEHITLNLSLYGKQRVGNILDISSVGLSCCFDEPIDLSKNELMKSVQLKLNGVLITTDCVMIGNRNDSGTTIYVLLFRIHPDKASLKSKIRGFIHNSLQKNLDKSLI